MADADTLAHIIREPSKTFATSVCALEASSRWAVTGMCNLGHQYATR